ncbi:MAG: hypothetical protein R3B09_14110 [Nannocystaceae bacterium]
MFASPRLASAIALVLLHSVLLPLTACGPAKSMTEGDDASASDSEGDPSSSSDSGSDTGTDSDTDATASSSDSGPGTDSDSDYDSDSDSDSGGPLELACDGAKWVRVHRPGEFYDLAVDSAGHVYGFGMLSHEGLSGDAILANLDPAGALVRNVLYATSSHDEALHGGVAADDHVYSLTHEKSQPRLRRHDPEGALVWVVDLDAVTGITFDPRDLAVAPDGSTAVGGLMEGGGTLVAKFDAGGQVLWIKEYADFLEVQGMNDAGVIAAATADGVTALGADGAVLWEAVHPLFNVGDVDVNAGGEVVLAGDNEEGTLSIARFDGAGALVHDTLFNVYDGFDKINDVAINDAGEIAASGYIQGPDPLTAFVAKVDREGEVVVTRLCEPSLDSRGYTVAIDEVGGLYLGGAVQIDYTYYSFAAAFE